MSSEHNAEARFKAQEWAERVAEARGARRALHFRFNGLLSREEQRLAERLAGEGPPTFRLSKL